MTLHSRLRKPVCLLAWLECKRHGNIKNIAPIPDICPVSGENSQEFKPQTSPPNGEIDSGIIFLCSQFVQLPCSSGVSVSGGEESCSTRYQQSVGITQIWTSEIWGIMQFTHICMYYVYHQIHLFITNLFFFLSLLIQTLSLVPWKGIFRIGSGIAPHSLLIPWFWLANPHGLILLTLYKLFKFQHPSLQLRRWRQDVPPIRWRTAKTLQAQQPKLPSGPTPPWKPQILNPPLV